MAEALPLQRFQSTATNWRLLTEEQASVYGWLAWRGPAVVDLAERRVNRQFWRGWKAAEIGLRQRRPPEGDGLGLGGFWAGFDWRRRRWLAGVEQW